MDGKEEKKGREAGSRQRRGTTPTVVASLRTQVSIGWLNWIISSKGKDYRESGEKVKVHRIQSVKRKNPLSFAWKQV